MWSYSSDYRSIQRPKYSIDFNESVSTSHVYDALNSRSVFTVEQGSRFFLKLKLTADPMPCSAELLKNGVLVKSSPYATIYVSIDRICIQTVYGQGYAGVYKLRCNNGLEGEISFELKVRGTYQNLFCTDCKYLEMFIHVEPLGYSQHDDYYDCYDPSRW